MSENVLRAINATETIIDDNCGISKFYAIATTLCDELQVVFLNHHDNGESVDWDFLYKKHCLTLHFDVYGGVSIVQNQPGHNNQYITKELSSWLHSHAY